MDTTTLPTPQLSAPAWRCLTLLEEAGFESWCVGGFVRDSLLGLTPSDVDLCTQARPEDMREIFSHNNISFHEVGSRYGTILALIDGESFEITSMRTEGDYSDARHPDQVHFCTDIHQDLLRRDFTINALAWHPKRGLVAPDGALADLEAGQLRCVGMPSKRFAEDPLRILRGLRFMSCRDVHCEPYTHEALLHEAHRLQQVASERICAELHQLVCGYRASTIIRSYFPIMYEILPELACMQDFDQHNPYHRYSVLEHSLAVLDATPPEIHLRWAALLHDCGKPETYVCDSCGIGHFPGHAARSKDLAHAIALRLGFPRSLRQTIETLIAHHDDHYPVSYEGVLIGIEALGSCELFWDLCALKRADEMGKACPYSTRYYESCQLEGLSRSMIEQGLPLCHKDLALSGRDLCALGLKPGPQFKSYLQAILLAVIQGQVGTGLEEQKAYAAHLLAKDNKG